MKRFYDLKCRSCGSVVETWISLEEVPTRECPKCGKKELERIFSPFSTGSSCGVGQRGRWVG